MKWKKLLFEGLKMCVFISIVAYIVKSTHRKANVDRNRAEKFKSYYEVLCRWLTIRNEGRWIADYLEKQGYYKIAIYGKGVLGELLYDELMDSKINVKYFTDSNDDMCFSFENIPTIPVENLFEQEKVDLMIITPVFALKEIEENLHTHGYNGKIITIYDVLKNA